MADSVISIKVDISQAEQALETLKKQYNESMDAHARASQKAIEELRKLQLVEDRLAESRKTVKAGGTMQDLIRQ